MPKFLQKFKTVSMKNIIIYLFPLMSLFSFSKSSVMKNDTLELSLSLTTDSINTGDPILYDIVFKNAGSKSFPFMTLHISQSNQQQRISYTRNLFLLFCIDFCS